MAKPNPQTGRKPAAAPALTAKFWLLGRRDLVVLAVIAVASWVAQSFFLNYTVDDAFITFRFSRNLVDGLGLVFNAGERVEGYTNFLWTVWCAIPFLLKINVLWFSKISLVILSTGSLVLTALLFRRLARNAPWWLTFLPVGLLALHTSFTVYAVNGIETQLFCFLLLLALNLAAREFEHGGWFSAVVFGLLFYTRPDGLAFFGLAWLARLAMGRRDRGFWTWTAVFAVMAGSLFAFRLGYYGRPFPNTYYAKSAGALADRVSMWGMRYFRDIFRVKANWLYMLLPLASVFFWKRLSRYARVVVVLPYVYLAYVLYIGGDVNFPHFRFLLHVLPLLAVGAFLPFAFPTPKSTPTKSRPGIAPWLAAGLSVVVLVLQLANTTSVWKAMNVTEESPPFRYLSLFPLAGPIFIYPEIADSLRQTCPPGAVVVMQDVGAIPFYSGVRTFDIIGLVNGPLAQYFYHKGYTDYHRGRLPMDLVQEVDAHVRDVIIDSVKADYVLYHVDSGDPRELGYSFHFHNLAFDPRFQELYQPVHLFSYPVTNRADHILFKRISKQ
jgi:arabinofuranosyltransferase